MSEQWNDTEIWKAIRVAQPVPGSALPVDRVFNLMRQMRDELTAKMESYRQIGITLLDANDSLKAEVKQLRRDSEKLEALQQCGVDNWEGYGEAMQLLRE